MKNNLIKNFTIIVSASGISQVIAFISAPIVANIYGPEIIGLFATVLSICTFVVPFINLSIPIAIPIINKDEDLKKIVTLLPKIIFITLFIALLTSTLIFYFNQSIFLSTGGPFFIFIFIVLLFLLSNREIAESKLIYKEELTKKARLLLIYTVIFALCRIFFGVINPNIFNLYLSQIFALLIFLNPTKKINKGLFRKFDKDEKKLLIQYKSFLNYRSFQVIINKFSQAMPLIFFSSFLSPVYAGYFAITKAILLIPSGIIGRTISEMMINKFKTIHLDKPSRLFKFLLLTQSILFISAIPFALLIYFYIDEVILLILGTKWMDVVIYTKFMLSWIVLAFTSSLSVIIINILHANRAFMYFEILHVFFRFSALYFCYRYSLDHLNVVALYSIVSALFNIFLINWVLFKTYKFSNVS